MLGQQWEFVSIIFLFLLQKELLSCASVINEFVENYQSLLVF